MAAYNSMNLHYIVKVNISEYEDSLPESGKYTIRKYEFVDKDGGTLTISAFMEDEE